MWIGKAFFSAFPWSTVSVLILSLSLRESKFTLSWLLRNTQQDINAWWVRKLWNEGRDRSLQKKVPCLYLLVCNSGLQCPWGCIDKAECRTCTVLRVSWVQSAATGKPCNSSHICYSGCGITWLAPCAIVMGIVVRLPRAKVSTLCVCGGTCMGGARALHVSFAIHTAFVRNFNTSVCQLLLWDSFVLPQWCEGRLSFTQKPLWAAGPSFYNGSTCRQKKRSSAFMLLCNRGFIPQRPSPADKNKTLHANGYFCHHPQRWHLLCPLLARDARVAESTSSSQEVQELPPPAKLVTSLGGHADREALWKRNSECQTFSSFW